MFYNFVTINGAFFRINGWALESVDSVPSGADVFDGSRLASIIDKFSLEDAATEVNDKRAEYDALTEAAKASGSKQDRDAQLAEKPALTVLLHAQKAKAELAAEQALIDAEEAPPAPVDTDALTVEDEDEDGDDASGGDASGVDTGTAEASTSDSAADLSVDDLVIPDDLSDLEETKQQAILAAAETIQRSPSFGQVVVDSAKPGRHVYTNEPGSGTVMRQFPDLSPSGGGPVLAGGSALEYETDQLNRMASQKGTRSAFIGRYQMFGETPKLFDGKGSSVTASGGFDRTEWRGGNDLVRTAAGEICPDSETVRRTVDPGNTSVGDLTGLVEEIPIDGACSVRTLQEIPISTMIGGLTMWGDAEASAYIAAREAHQAAILSGVQADITTTYADLLAVEKSCYTAGCAPISDPMTTQAIYRCLNWSIQNARCSPEHLALNKAALNKLFTRAMNAHMLASLANWSTKVTADLSAAPFVNVDGIALDSGLALEYVARTLESQGRVRERITEGNYTMIVPHGLAALLNMGDRITCDKAVKELKFVTGADNVVVSLDFPASATDPAPGGNYPPVPSAAATAGAGNAVDFNTLLAPSAWNVWLGDLDGFFKITQPEIEVTAQVTPESIRGNWTAGESYEQFAAYMKDGSAPAFSIDLTGVNPNGARIGCISPEGMQFTN